MPPAPTFLPGSVPPPAVPPPDSPEHFVLPHPPGEYRKHPAAPGQPAGSEAGFFPSPPVLPDSWQKGKKMPPHPAGTGQIPPCYSLISISVSDPFSPYLSPLSNYLRKPCFTTPALRRFSPSTRLLIGLPDMEIIFCTI